MRIQRKILLLSLTLPLFAGLISSLIIKDDVSMFQTLQLPPLAPPSWIFPIVWTALYLLMGISCYLIITFNHFDRAKALSVYFIQLTLNFLWAPVFFHFQRYFLAFLIIILLIAIVLLMIQLFYQISPLAAFLQLPYLLWLFFAAYLNVAILFLN